MRLATIVKNDPMNIGQVIWITGLPGSGKSTLAYGIKDELQNAEVNPIVLDGDSLREVFSQTNNFDRKSRYALALKYSRLAALLSRQGHLVIVSTVSLFHEIHDFNRRSLPNYLEVFIDVPQNVLIQRDQKGLYSSGNDSLPGISQTAEFPKKPDLKLNQSGKQSLSDMISVVMPILNSGF
jgi:adenylylsulfate kinase